MKTLAFVWFASIALGSVARADDGAKPPAEPPAQAAPAQPAPKLLDGPGSKPRQVSIHDSHRDNDRPVGRDCETNALGQVECKAPPVKSSR